MPMTTATKAHRHLLVYARIARPISTIVQAKRWILDLAKKVEMKPLARPVAVYCALKGNRGLTVILPITTSHIVAHFWDEVDPTLLQLDVYSCASFDPNIVLDLLG